MPWCPKCKYEYREGIAVCADCGCELVDDLSLVMENTDEVYDEELLELAEDFELELDEPVEGEQLTAHQDEYHPYKSGIYVNNEEKAEENRTSAYTLISVGIIGIVLLVLFFLGVIPINMPNFNKYMITGVMGAMFLLFLIMGIVSLRNFKIFKKKAVSENNLTNEIKNWCVNNITKGEVDKEFDFSETPDEVRYFQRFQYLKNSITNQFMNLEDSYVERIAEEVYPDIFE